jgi:nucleoside-diphosphate-sugar epimerase
MRKSNDELIKACFPGVKYNKTAGPNDTLLSIEKAKRELGYKPEYDWK